MKFTAEQVDRIREYHRWIGEDGGTIFDVGLFDSLFVEGFKKEEASEVFLGI